MYSIKGLLYSAPLLRAAPKSWQKWIICLSGGLLCFFQVTQAFLLNSLNSPITKTFFLSATKIGYVAVSYFIGNVSFAIIAGMLATHYPRRTMLAIALFINLLSIALFASAEGIEQMIIAQLISGMVGTFPLPCSVFLASSWFPLSKRPLIISMMAGSFGALGGTCSQGPIVLLVEKIGWRNTLWVDDIIGIVFFIIIVLFVEDLHRFPHPGLARVGKNFLKFLKDIMVNIQNWLSGCYVALINMSSIVLSALWGNLFLTQVYGLTSEEASLFMTFFFICSIIGGPSLGWAAGKLNSIKPFMWLASSAALMGSLFLFESELSWPSLFLAFGLLGFSSSAQSLAYTHASQCNKKKLIPAAQGLIITVAMSGGLEQSIFSWLLQKNWGGKIISGQPYYSISDYHKGLYIFPICFVISLLLVFLLNKTEKK